MHAHVRMCRLGGPQHKICQDLLPGLDERNDHGSQRSMVRTRLCRVLDILVVVSSEAICVGEWETTGLGEGGGGGGGGSGVSGAGGGGFLMDGSPNEMVHLVAELQVNVLVRGLGHGRTIITQAPASSMAMETEPEKRRHE